MTSPPALNRRELLRLALVGGGALLAQACQPASQPTTPAAAGTQLSQPTTAPVAAGQSPLPATSPVPAASPAAAAPSAASASPVAAAVSATPAFPQLGAAAPGTTPRTGGTLKQGFPADLQGFDPQLKTNSNDAMWLGVYDRLTMYDGNLQPVPLLAESWDISSDARSIKLNLRQGVTFHTGREFTSDDVKYTVQRTADPKTAAGQYAGHGGLVHGCRDT